MKYSKDEKLRMMNGDSRLLLSIIEAEEAKVLAALKTSKDDARFYQGASYIIDELLKIFKK